MSTAHQHLASQTHRSPATLPGMTTTASAYAWAIMDIGAQTTTPHRAGRASSHAAAWTAALRAARTALFAGELDTLAVTIGDDHCGALYAPARDQDGHINPDQLTAALIELHQAATAAELADQLTYLTHMSS
jgi:hypothetical protein